ncbi:MAG: helix-turn-helix domain-containing protein [Cloacibacillus sp.]|nr:helix-turn-helix domain-containing protein [Cloacibacillus sp.]
MDTLECIEKNSWNLKQSSVEMNFHYNTLKYRYQRIQEILDIDLALPVNRFNVALALKLYSLRGR